jgi:hypothetical protein
MFDLQMRSAGSPMLWRVVQIVQFDVHAQKRNIHCTPRFCTKLVVMGRANANRFVADLVEVP